MIISVDGGALCAPKKDFLGTSIFSHNFIQALQKNDRQNTYKIYTFCNLAGRKNIKKLPKKGFMQLGVTSQEIINPSDIFLALNQAIPLRTNAKIISFCHGLSYIRYPEHYKTLFNKFIGQLKNMTSRSDAIIVSSIKVKKDLIRFKPSLKAPVYVVPFGVPIDFLETIKSKRKKYFLFVGSNAAIKNIDFLVDSFRIFRKNENYSQFELYLVGQHYKYNNLKNIKVYPTLNRNKIKRLYQEATCYISASHYESFNLPVLEALSQNCPVVAKKTSVIEEMRLYVKLANNSNDFVKLMQSAADGKMSYNYSKEINSVFNWKNYVLELKKIYETISDRTYTQRGR